MINKVDRQTYSNDSADVNISKNERIVSAFGAALVFLASVKGFKDMPVASALKLIGGTYLTYRSITGHCPLSEAIGRTTVNKT